MAWYTDLLGVLGTSFKIGKASLSTSAVSTAQTFSFPATGGTLATTEVPQNAQTGNYTLVAGDAGKHIYHASGASAATYTIPANSSVAYAVGTTISFVNLSTNNVTIAITSDTLYLAGAGTTGSRTLAQYGVVTALKITSTAWIISGNGLT